MTDTAASVKARLLRYAREHEEDFNLTLTRYAIERLLYRLTKSPYSNEIVLKGAQLLHAYTHQRFRPTRDLDLLGHGDDEPSRWKAIFGHICKIAVESDGLVFDEGSITAEEIRTTDDYGGTRVRLTTYLGSARIRTQVDIGFGDAITPGPVTIVYPTMLDTPSPVLRGYPLPTVIAEKLESLTSRGLATSRMKDVYDLWRIATAFEIDYDDVSSAVIRTFARRDTPRPVAPLVMTEAFWTDDGKQRQWTAFLRRIGERRPSLQEACTTIARHFGTPFRAE